jgi:hypothetical protein
MLAVQRVSLTTGATMKTYRFIFEMKDGKHAVNHNLHNDRDARDDAAEIFNRDIGIKKLIIKNGNKKIVELVRT